MLQLTEVVESKIENPSLSPHPSFSERPGIMRVASHTQCPIPFPGFIKLPRITQLAKIDPHKIPCIYIEPQKYENSFNIPDMIALRKTGRQQIDLLRYFCTTYRATHLLQIRKNREDKIDLGCTVLVFSNDVSTSATLGGRQPDRTCLSIAPLL